MIVYKAAGEAPLRRARITPKAEPAAAEVVAACVAAAEVAVTWVDGRILTLISCSEFPGEILVHVELSLKEKSVS